MQLLAGKVAIVTGASSGIGYAAAALFARHGAKVIAAARRSAELRQLVEAVTGEGGAARACSRRRQRRRVRHKGWSIPRSPSSAGSTSPSTTPAPSAISVP